MTETTLRVNHEMVLSEELKYTKFQTNSVRNMVEEQTLEKGYQPYSANSANATTVTWSIPSISGGAMVRELDVEVPISWTITAKVAEPKASSCVGSDLPPDVAPQGVILDVFPGTSPRAFLSEINTIDQFPLSKIMGNREYILNNSSTILKEEFDPEQIDLMVAQLDLKKVENLGVKVFSDANSHFQVLAHSCGGNLRPYTVNSDVGGTTEGFEQLIATNIWGPSYDDAQNGMASSIMNWVRNPARLVAGVCDDWFQCRNTARNIQASSVTISGLTGPGASSGKTAGMGSNIVPVVTSTQPGISGDFSVVYYQTSSDFKVKVNYTIRERLISQYWDNDLTYNKMAWNKLIPLSSLNIKVNLNTTYLSEGFLKIGDAVNTYKTYSITEAPAIARDDLSKIKLWVRQCKIPLALLPRESYKVLYYAQERPQASKDLSFNNGKVTAEMTYSNLSQIPEYLFIYLPINKGEYIKQLYPQPNPNPSNVPATVPSQLPSTFNFPISNLVLTFNADTALATYGLDAYQLQQFTMENLQDAECLRNLVVGESKCAVGEFQPSNLIKNEEAPGGVSLVKGDALKIVNVRWNEKYGGHEKARYKYNGISNSSFFILKLGSQIRLPEGYTPSQIVNYNLTVKAECDVNSDAFRNLNAGYESDLKVLRELDSSKFSQLRGKMEVVHFNKRIFSLSGDALQNLYVHNVQITSAEYKALQTQFEMNFSSMEKQDVFSTDMMIGGSFLSRLKDKAMSAVEWLAPKVQKVGEYGRKAVDLAKCAGFEHPIVSMADTGLKHVGYGRDPHEVGAGKKRGRKSGSVDWKAYMDSM